MFTIETTAGALAVQYQEAPRLMAATLMRSLREIGLKLVASVQQQHLSGQDLAVRTGTLRRSVFSQVEIESPTSALVRVGIDANKAVYGRIQEYGGTITPKKGQFLAIPLEAMQTGNGVARATAQQVKDAPETFGFTSTFVHGGVIFGTRGKKAIVPLFALKTSVTIPTTSYLRNTLLENQGWIRDRLGLEVTDSMRALGGTSGRATPAGFGA